MKEVANDLAKLLAVIILTITLAISTAALSQWAGADTDAPAEQATPTAALAAS
jgi:hypothetical protein